MGKSLIRRLALLCSLILLMSLGGVWATWKYASGGPLDSGTDLSINVNEFTFIQDMPEGEVSLLDRLYDILNNKYSNNIIPEGESCNYLISNLDKDWHVGVTPSLGSFVGSMDTTEQSKET